MIELYYTYKYTLKNCGTGSFNLVLVNVPSKYKRVRSNFWQGKEIFCFLKMIRYVVTNCKNKSKYGFWCFRLDFQKTNLEKLPLPTNTKCIQNSLSNIPTILDN